MKNENKLREYLDECFSNSNGLDKIKYRTDCIHQLAFGSGSMLMLNKDSIQKINKSLKGKYKLKTHNYKTCIIERMN